MRRSPFFFFKASWLLFSFFLLATVGMGMYVWTPDPEAAAFYEQLNAATKKTDWNKHPLKQKRQGVVKEILFNAGSTLQKLRLECPEAEIVFLENEGKGEIQERMYNVSGWIQEKLYYRLPNGKLIEEGSNTAILLSNKDQAAPFQAVSYFEADTALYSFDHESLTAEQVFLNRYILPSHLLPTSSMGAPEMTGTARQLDFSLKDKKFNLNAKGFKGRFDALESLR